MSVVQFFIKKFQLWIAPSLRTGVYFSITSAKFNYFERCIRQNAPTVWCSGRVPSFFQKSFQNTDLVSKYWLFQVTHLDEIA